MAHIDLIRRLSASLRIAHHIPGRVRLKLDASADAGVAAAAGDVESLRRSLSGSPGIRTVSLNPLARSCTIEYDPSVIPPTAWPDLLHGDLSAGAQTLLRIVAAGLGPARA